ncbi:MAG: TonB-dependent receptor [Polyangiaceae bacterium]|nr:TonB-dependent receptor [Polyangiaceae bacterium]
MRNHTRARGITHAALGATWLATLAAPAMGQEPAAADDPSPPVATRAPSGVTPPRVVERSEPAWPEGEVGTKPVTVVLRITVEADGRVSEVEVVTAPAAAFGEAAASAIQRSRFAPAERAGKPVRARITYEARIAPAPAPVPTLPAAKVPPANAEATPSPSSAGSGSDGATPPAPPPADFETARDATAAALEDEGFGAVAAIEAPPREVTRRTVAAAEIAKIPGTAGDAIRAIEVMPGVARTSEGDDPIIRGAAWNETQTYVEGAFVPYIFHVAAKSAFNSRLVERVDLYPGNFSARYGRAVGGIIDIKARDPRTDAIHGLLELSVFDSMAMLEAPLGEDTAVAVAGRRSNIDFFFEQFLSDAHYSVAAAPLYWDYQGLAIHRFGSKHTLRLMAHGSHDSMRLFMADPSDFDPSLRGRLEFASEYHIGMASLDSELGPVVDQHLQLSVGRFGGLMVMGPLETEFEIWQGAARADWGVRVSEAVRLNVGFDGEFQRLYGDYEGQPPPQSEGDSNPEESSSTIDMVHVEDTVHMVRPAGYAEAEIRPVEQLLLVPGVRVDGFVDTADVTVDPRVSARYEATESTALKWGIGLFSQPPVYYETLEKIGNPDVEPTHALHTSAGVEQAIGDSFSFGLEGFYKYLYHRVVATDGLVPPRFLNDGSGRIYGAELSARYRTKRTFAYLAYTLSRSERQDRTDDWRLFEQDQTHILAFTASHALGRGWEVGARMRVVSGDPYTPVKGSVYDAGVDGYAPYYGRPYSARNPVFHQLDVRGEKEWTIKRLKLAVYLDVMNAYNAQTQQGLDYSFDYSTRESYSGLPVIPNLGVRGEL